MRFHKRHFGSAILVLAGALCSVTLQPAAAAAPPISWPTAEWPTSTPEQQGMSSNALADLVDLGEAHAMDSLLVIRHGQIVASCGERAVVD